MGDPSNSGNQACAEDDSFVLKVYFPRVSKEGDLQPIKKREGLFKYNLRSRKAGGDVFDGGTEGGLGLNFEKDLWFLAEAESPIFLWLKIKQ